MFSFLNYYCVVYCVALFRYRIRAMCTLMPLCHPHLLTPSLSSPRLAGRPGTEEKNATFLWKTFVGKHLAEGGLQSSRQACNSMFALQCLDAPGRRSCILEEINATHFPKGPTKTCKALKCEHRVGQDTGQTQCQHLQHQTGCMCAELRFFLPSLAAVEGKHLVSQDSFLSRQIQDILGCSWYHKADPSQRGYFRV